MGRWLTLLAVATACRYTSGAAIDLDGPADADATVPCGNGVADPGEECDDGNRTAGDGCDATCHAEPAWQCPPAGPCKHVIGLSFSGGTDLAPVGSSGGGGTYTLGCNAGEALVGFDGHDSLTNVVVGQLRAACAAVAFGADGAVAWTVTHATGYAGNESNGNFGPTQCAKSGLLVGFVGYAGSYLDGLQLICRPVSFVHNALMLGTPRTLGGWGHSGGIPAPPESCADVQAVTTFDGFAGAVIDHFTLRCFAMAPVT